MIFEVISLELVEAGYIWPCRVRWIAVKQPFAYSEGQLTCSTWVIRYMLSFLDLRDAISFLTCPSSERPDQMEKSHFSSNINT